MEYNNETFTFDTVLENEGEQYITLPEGDYMYVVKDFQRGNFPGSAKIPACLKATITVEVTTENGKATIKFDLMLAKIMEWKLCAFFRSIGQKKHGEPLKPNWGKVIGSIGKAHFKQREWVNDKGETKVANDLDYFIDYNPEDFVVDDKDLPF